MGPVAGFTPEAEFSIQETTLARQENLGIGKAIALLRFHEISSSVLRMRLPRAYGPAVHPL